MGGEGDEIITICADGKRKLQCERGSSFNKNIGPGRYYRPYFAQKLFLRACASNRPSL